MYKYIKCDKPLPPEKEKGGNSVSMIDMDTMRVGHLKWEGYSAFLGDFGSPEVLKRAGIAGARVVITAVRDLRTTERALNAIGQLKAQLGIRPLVLALVSDKAEMPEVKSLGADEALSSNQIIADFVISRLEKI